MRRRQTSISVRNLSDIDEEWGEDDDEIYFDSNGMPIVVHDDDDDTEVRETTAKDAVEKPKSEDTNADNAQIKQSTPTPSPPPPPLPKYNDQSNPKKNSNDGSPTTTSKQQVDDTDIDANPKEDAKSADEDSHRINSNTSQTKPSKPPTSPPPPPPLPKEKTSDESSNENTKHDNNKDHQDDIKDEDNTTRSKLFNHTNHHATNDSTQADTIFDDILRGFSFASIFCMCMICLHKACYYSCVRCGIVPDERVVEARWRRFQLKNKRAYFNPNVSPPMDTKSLGKWLANNRVGGTELGVWDSEMDDFDGSSTGDIDFDDGIQLSAWEKDDASSAAELEYGEGTLLEDKSHDERLFDGDNGGLGVEKEANKFFEGRKRTGNNCGKKPEIIYYNGRANSSGSAISQERPQTDNEISDESFFDALNPPSQHSDSFPEDHDNTAAKDFAKIHSNDYFDATTNDNDREEHENSFDDNDVSTDDRGYDEESDLLGLRSDSPPPLDLEEIEKKLREDMEKAPFY